MYGIALCWLLSASLSPTFDLALCTKCAVPTLNMCLQHKIAFFLALQFEEPSLDRGQALERCTASLPSLPGQSSYRQELLGGFPSRSHDCRRSANLSAWRRPSYSFGGSDQVRGLLLFSRSNITDITM